MPRRKISVFLVDDHLVVRIGLRSLLEVQPDMVVVGEVAGGVAAVAMYRELRPDVTLMDLRMPDLSGTDATIAIRQEHPEARVLMLTTFDNDEDIYRALAAGAVGYLLKNSDGETLLGTIRSIHEGSYALPAALVKRIARREAAPELSPRELEVLGLIVKGRCNKEIGSTLGLTENTVKNHVKMILEKLGVDGRTQAVTVALRRGLANLD